MRTSRPAHPRRRKPKATITAELKADWAMERYGSLKTSGTTTGIKTIAAKSKRDPTVVTRAIAQAFEEELVEVRKTDRPSDPVRNKNFEERLLEKYRKLHYAIVIESVSTPSPPPPDPRKDPRQQRLGMAMARFIASGSVLQNGAVVGVGSGRGVEMTVDSLAFFPLLRAEDVTLMSLTGSVYSTPNATTKGLWLDADRHVIELAKRFLDEPKQYLIGHPIAFEPHDLKHARERVWLRSLQDDGSVDKHRHVPEMTHVLSGIGTLAPLHRFYEEAKAKPEEQEPFLKPIHNHLINLKTLCEKATAGLTGVPHYSPAAEMSNVFLYVPPPPGLAIPNSGEIVACIEAINQRLLNVRQIHLKRTQMMVVAGTKQKAHAIRALLDEFPVRYLCTDAEAAVGILDGQA